MTAEDLKWRAQDLQAAYINAYHEPEKLAVLREAMRDLWNEAVEECSIEPTDIAERQAIRAKRLPDSNEGEGK